MHGCALYAPLPSFFFIAPIHFELNEAVAGEKKKITGKLWKYNKQRREGGGMDQYVAATTTVGGEKCYKSKMLCNWTQQDIVTQLAD